MSVTTTDNARVTAVRHALADYELHHSDPDPEAAAPAPAPNAHAHDDETASSNPPGWPTDSWRRVPAYRPVRHQRDEQRDSYNNAIERNFVRVMFGGVYTMAVSTCLASEGSDGGGVVADADVGCFAVDDEPDMAEHRWKAEQRLFCFQDRGRVVGLPTRAAMKRRLPFPCPWSSFFTHAAYGNSCAAISVATHSPNPTPGPQNPSSVTVSPSST